MEHTLYWNIDDYLCIPKMNGLVQNYHVAIVNTE